VLLVSRGEAVAGTIRHRGRLYKLTPGARGAARLEEVSTHDPLPHPPFEMIPDIAPEALADTAGDGSGGTATQSAGDGASIVDVLVAYTPEARRPTAVWTASRRSSRSRWWRPIRPT